ncbi:MAG: hypothetical protein FJW20_03590 [Acidimicrobiia bacterium]|nr:hypothetical protein [Acidimicrobiia bacterium]
MNCEKAREQLPLYVYGELEFTPEEEMEQHFSECGECREALERERRMHAALEATAVSAPAALLSECRRELRSVIRAKAERRPWWRRWLPGEFHWMQPAAAAALLAVGFFSARLAPVKVGAETRNGEVTASRVRLIEPDRNGAVRIVLEETRQRDVFGRPDEDRVRRLLLRAAQEPADAGLRVESLDLLKAETTAREVREALKQALLEDPNPGVRMKALEALKPYAEQAEVRHALSQVLLKDESSGLRTQAIDLLIQHRTGDLVGVLQELMRHEENDYIRLRTQRVLQEMKASVETF